ncbi:MAG: Eco57I restriction-modification methylase domain-containing protein [Eggerthellaceae bacterium]|nr:Eco57I restriction-modification methylase domain-containing protein [Eggerthellaceae bacterium]
MAQALQQAAITRINAIQATSEEKRQALAQHLTPMETATLAASMFSDLKPDQQFIRCLDLGAGSGILSIALYERYDGHIETIEAIEADPVLATVCDAELASVGVPHSLTLGDALTGTPPGPYDRIVLNPPYKKMAADDARQDGLPCHSANLYSAFMAIGLSRLAEDGELVAIVPRSWMNGEYFAPFRKYALGEFSLDRIHVYGSRTEVFADTDVLQDTMLVRFSRQTQSETIVVTQSAGKADAVERREHAACDLIEPETLVVRIAPKENDAIEGTIASEGLCPSTGKVVDFRNRERIYDERPEADGVRRLVYAGNFPHGALEHPLPIGKPQWYRADDEASIRQLTQPGCYVVVKRFSSKEERRRVVAYPLKIDEPVGLENHLNFIHGGKPRKVVPLGSEALSRGLALWLNTTYIDDWFRDVSGSTQVNAGDIKAMPCPPLESLEAIGGKWRPGISQEEIDRVCEVLR